MSLKHYKTQLVIDAFNSLNSNVVKKVKKVSGVNPRTKVAGITRSTFSLDISTGKIYVVPNVSKEVGVGYLTHENGHRSVFPVSSAGSTAFITAIKSFVPEATNKEVTAVANIVADAFSDLVLSKLGLASDLAKRIPHFMSSVKTVDLGMAFKLITYKAIEVAEKKKRSVSDVDVNEAYEWLIKRGDVAGYVASKAKKLVRDLLSGTNNLLTNTNVPNIANFLLNPFTTKHPPNLHFLVLIAVEILKVSKELGASPSSSNESAGGEGADVAPSKISVVDVQKATQIAYQGFGAPRRRVGLAIEEVFSNEIKEAVKKLINKIKVTYAQNDFTLRKPSGVTKKSSELWLRPRGEPDEDSVLIEPRKLLWRVTYKVPTPRGRLFTSPTSVPKELIIVLDESGSTEEGFDGTNVVSAEAFVSLIVLAGLKYRGGAKYVSILKFSDTPERVYSGGNEVEAGVKLLTPSKVSGGGTNILSAVKQAISLATKNTALVIVTDAIIDVFTAKEVSTLIKNEVDAGKVGFAVFIIINKQEIPTISIIKKNLSGKNSIVAHIKNADDLTQVSQATMLHILRTYSTT